MAHNEPQKEILLQWLKDAYAMEKGIVEVLEGHEKDAEDYPKVQKKIREHIEMTEGQAQHIEECIKNLGGDTSGIKTVLSQIMGNASSMMSHLPSDKIVKNAIAEFSTEYFEIACYSAIIAAAEKIGETEIAEVCAEIRDQEQETADWLEENLPTLIEEYMDTEVEK